MSSGFVPAGTILPDRSEETETDAAWAAARAAVSQKANPATSSSTSGTSGAAAQPEDNRSLYDILQANKAKKQEEFEEKLKFKNQFRALDEDDIEFLDSVLDGQKRVEKEMRKAVEGEVERFREMQEKVVVEGTAIPEDEEETAQWGKRKRTGGRKPSLGVKLKKKGEEEEGVKKRKVEKTEEVEKEKEKSPVKAEEVKKVEQVEKKEEKKEEKKVPAQSPPKPTAPPAAVLGLDYGSDDDSD